MSSSPRRSSPGESIRARLGRLIAIAIAILVGVSFVVGSFVLADSLRKHVRRPVHPDQPGRRPRGPLPVAFGDDSADPSATRSRPASPTSRPGRGRRDDRATAAALRPARRPATASRSRPRARRRSAWPGAATHRCPGWRSRARAGRRAGPTRWPSTRPAPIGRTSRSATRSR